MQFIIYGNCNLGNIDYNNISPTRGQVGKKIVNITLQNLTANDAGVNEIDIKMWDGNYLSDLFVSMSGITLGTCNSISTTDWGSNKYRCTTGIHIPAGATVTLSINGDIGSDYPTYEMLGTDLPAITAVDASGNSIPFLPPTGNAISVNYTKG